MILFQLYPLPVPSVRFYSQTLEQLRAGIGTEDVDRMTSTAVLTEEVEERDRWPFVPERGSFRLYTDVLFVTRTHTYRCTH